MVQEVRWLNSGNIQSGVLTIFYSGPRTGRHRKEVGFVMNAMMSQGNFSMNKMFSSELLSKKTKKKLCISYRQLS